MINEIKSLSIGLVLILKIKEKARKAHTTINNETTYLNALECVFFPNIPCRISRTDNCINNVDNVIRPFFEHNALLSYFGVSRNMNARSIWQFQNTNVIFTGPLLS
jgi:hypothetical protein